MNWDAISAVGEILGAIAVLVTLIYLAKQIRQNTQEIRASRVEAMLKDQANYNQMLAENKDMARIYWAAVENVDALPEEEKLRWLHMCSVMMRNSEVAYFHFRQGDLPEELYLSRERWIRRYLGESGFRWWWRQYSDVLDPEFVRYVDDLLGADQSDSPEAGIGERVTG